MNINKCLSDADLNQLCEGNVTAQNREIFKKHIESCLDCSKRWQQVVQGHTILESMLHDARSGRGKCPSKETLDSFIANRLDPKTAWAIEEHLVHCQRCMDKTAEKFSDAYTELGEDIDSEYAGIELMRLLARIPDQIDELLDLIRVNETTVSAPADVIKLPILEPEGSASLRLAAATGDGFYEQRLYQKEPPFEFYLIQFGQQIRIEIQDKGKDVAYDHCLGRLKILEADTCKYSEVVHVQNGKAQCVIGPDKVKSLQPQRQDLKVKFEPFLTLKDLTSIGIEAYRPIFARLLEHTDPQFRKAVVETVAMVYGPKAHSLIGHMISDEDESVRKAAKQALNRFKLDLEK